MAGCKDGWVAIGAALSGLLTLALAIALTGAPAQAGPLLTDDAAVLQSAVAKDADGVLEYLRDVVNGHGGVGGISAEALAGEVLLARAEARAAYLRRVQAVDLDWDGALTAKEVTLAGDTVSAYARARLLRMVEPADRDADGTLSEAEVEAGASDAALRAFPQAEADLLRAAMKLDADGNGLLTLEEVKAGVAKLASSVAADDGA